MSNHILIVEDHPLLSDAIATVVETLPNTTHHIIRDGRDVIPYLHRREPDLLLLDLHLPHVGGRMILQQLVQANICSNMRIVILTADSLLGDIIFAEFPIVDRLLEKPFSMRSLGHELRLILANTAPA